MNCTKCNEESTDLVLVENIDLCLECCSWLKACISRTNLALGLLQCKFDTEIEALSGN